MAGARTNHQRNDEISFRQLKLFDVVGRLGNITKAAEECGLTQPAATQSLTLLARKVGVRLLDGGPKGTSLTPSGREFYTRVRLLLEKLDRGLRRVEINHPENVAWHLSHPQVRLLHAMRERGDLARAILALETSSRAATRTLRLLESLLEQQITIPETGQTVLTATGTSLADKIGLLSEEVSWIAREVREHGNRAARTVVLGVAGDPGTASLNAAIQTFIKRLSGWCVEIIEAGQNDLLARLMIGEIDYVIGHILDDPGERIEWRQLTTLSFRVVARAGHRLASKRIVATRDLSGETWIFGAAGSRRRAASDILFAGRTPPPCVLVTSAAPLMAHVMLDGDHLGLMTDSEVALRNGTIVGIAHSAPPTLAKIGIATRVGWVPADVHDDLADLISNQFESS